MPLPIALDYRPALLSFAGIGRAVRGLAAALAQRDDVTVHLFGHSLAAARRPAAVPPRARLHRLPIPGRTLPWLHRLGVGAEHLAGRVGVFHWTDYVQPPLSRAAAVLTVHDLAFERDPSWHGANTAVLRERTRAALAAAAAVVVPSQTTAADLRTFVPEAKTPHVIPFGADHVVPEHVGPTHPFAGRPYALCLGTIEPRKDHRTLLAAWRQLPEPRPLLVVVGRAGWQCDDTVADLRTAERERRAVWIAAADDAFAFQLLRHAELLVYPSLWEGFGFPPLEAMQLGVPVVAADTAPMRELGDGALALVTPHDAAALAEGVARVLGDRTHAERLRAAGRRRAAAFRWRDCAEAHAALYREVAP